ncbi:MAG: hypothetical protein ABI867_43660, partial [Kofleriaceae bacterium]
AAPSAPLRVRRSPDLSIDFAAPSAPLRVRRSPDLSIEGDDKHAGVRLSLDVGSSALAIKSAILPAPEGWASAAGRAPLAAQWNLDLLVLRSWLAPCTRTFGLDLSMIDTLGIRAARVIVHSFDPGEKLGTGVVSLDLTSKRFFEPYLDIPLRSTLESKKNYGPYAGRELSIPFGPTIDYVLTDQMALAGVGEGLLARAVGRGAGPPGALLAIELAPAGLAKDAWEFLLQTAGVASSRRVTERLLAWRDARITLQASGTHLVLEASGNRR